MKKILLSLFWVLLIIGSSAYAQNRTVSGTVTGSDDGLPLVGVSVRIKGTNSGTQTDLNGKFTISVPSSRSLLEFSFIGFARQERIAATSTIAVSLVAVTNSLSEVVVVGYGTQERRDITGSVGKVSGAEIANKPVPSFDKALAGQVTGVQVSESSGILGAPPVIRVRGDNSLTQGNGPLYVVDGIPIITGNQ